MATGANPGSHGVKALVLTGPKSSGKSWLATEIQAAFGGLIVGGYVRYFIEQNPRATCYADIPAIAQGQLAWEDAAGARRPHLLILDTHLLSNQLWNQTLFCDCPRGRRSNSFNPWQALPEHRPLGAINRLRKNVYAAVIVYRHARNQPTPTP
jgi:hypothetical protein